MCLSSPKPPKPNNSALRAQREAARRAEQEAARRAEEERRREAARQARIAEGKSAIDSSFEPFNDEYYGGYEKAYLDYKNPQLERFYDEARDTTTYNLARAGNLESSAGAEALGDLTRDFEIQRGAITSEAKARAAQHREEVEAARSALYSQNQAQADPNAISSSAGQRVTALRTPPTFQPMGNPFGNILNTAAAGAGAMMGGRPVGAPLVFDQRTATAAKPNKSSVRLVGG